MDLIHEIGHAIGMTHQNIDDTCIMFHATIDYVRDNHFSDYSKTQIEIHNK